MDNPSDKDTTVTVQVGHITTEDGDIEPVTQDVVIPAGETSVTFELENNQDDLVEGTEDYKVEIVDTDNDRVKIDNSSKEATTSIIDDDKAVVCLTQDSTDVQEGDSHTYKLLLDKPTEFDTTVSITVSNITTEDGDVTPVTKDVVIPAGSTSATFTLEAVDDDIAESDEDYKVEISGVDSDLVEISSTQNTVTTTIEDNDVAKVSITQDEKSVDEGDVHVYALHLDKPSSSDTTVTVTVGHITTDDGDLEPLTQDVTIPAGETDVTFEVFAVYDDLVESNEDYKVVITDVDGNGVEIDQDHKEVTSTIKDSEEGVVTLTQDSTTVGEGDSHTYTVHLDKPSSSDTTVTVEVGHITTDDGDVKAVTKEVVVPAGETEATFKVDTIDDDKIEDDESFKVSISDVDNPKYKISSDESSVETTIEDNDRVVVSLSQNSEDVGEGGTHTYTLSLDRANIEDTTVTVKVVHDSTDDNDVSPITQEVTIPAGTTDISFTIDAIDDLIVEGTETYSVNIEDVSSKYVKISSDHRSVETDITDNDCAVVGITQNSLDVQEGDSHTYTLLLSKVSSEDTTVSVQVGNITTEDGDVTPVTRDIVIPAGENSAEFTINATDDDIVECDEKYEVEIVNVDGNNIQIDQENYKVETTIEDNDTAKVSITQESDSVDEGGSHTYTVSLDKVSETDTDVVVKISHIDTDENDLHAETKTITIPAGESSATFTVDNIDDTVPEDDEKYKVSIESVSNSCEGDECDSSNVEIDEDAKSVTTTIVDNEPNVAQEAAPTSVISITEEARNIKEGDTNTYTLHLDKPQLTDTVVSIKVGNVTTEDEDVTPLTQDVVIPAGETSVSFEVATVDDDLVEANEDFVVKILSTDNDNVTIDSDNKSVTTTIVDNDVNETDSNNWGDDPITVLADGGYIVPFLATSDVNSSDGDGYGVFFQRYDADGNKVGEPQLANTTTEGNQYEADVAALEDGGYVLAWQSSVGDGDGNGIYLQRYDADGNKVGGETLVNTTTQGDQSQVVITGLKDGGYTVAWQSENSDGDGYGIYLQKFDVNGAKVGSEVLVNETTQANQTMPAIDELENGGFVVSWQDDSKGTQEAYSRVFDTNMNSSNEIHVNSSTMGDQTLPMVSGLKDGGFVTTWISYDGNEASIVLQRFDSSGEKVGGETEVSKLTDFDLYSNVTPEVAGLDDGGYVVVFADKDSDGSGVYYQRYDADGNEMGERVLLNEDESANQYNPHVTELNDGGFLTTWVNVSEDMSSMEVVGQRFDADGNRVDEIFKVSDITTDSKVVSDLLNSHEIDEVETSANSDTSILDSVEYLDFESVATQNELQEADNTTLDHVEDALKDVSLNDLITDISNEIEMNIPQEPTQEQNDNTPSDQHVIKPAVIEELTQEVDISDNQNFIDITQHQVIVEDI